MRKIILTLFLATPLISKGQTMYPVGSFQTELSEYVIGADTIREGVKISMNDDSATVKKITKRKLENGTVGIYATVKGGWYVPLDQNAKDFALKKEKPETDDTITTATGYKIGVGQKLKIGVGSTPDGDFKFIRINAGSMFRNTSSGSRYGANSANAFARDNAGYSFKVIRLETRGSSRNGYVNFVIINSVMGGLLKYEIDIENAIKYGEIEVPDKYRPVSKNAVIQVVPSAADELLKFKKLLDSGVITQEEYDAQKKKLLDKQ